LQALPRRPAFLAQFLFQQRLLDQPVLSESLRVDPGRERPYAGRSYTGDEAGANLDPVVA
jgi:hypothetical protein